MFHVDGLLTVRMSVYVTKIYLGQNQEEREFAEKGMTPRTKNQRRRGQKLWLSMLTKRMAYSEARE